jgi:hypothetical protein
MVTPSGRSLYGVAGPLLSSRRRPDPLLFMTKRSDWTKGRRFMPEVLTEASQNDKDRGEHERCPGLTSPRPTRVGSKGKPRKRQAGLVVEIHITMPPRGWPFGQEPVEKYSADLKPSGEVDWRARQNGFQGLRREF